MKCKSIWSSFQNGAGCVWYGISSCQLSSLLFLVQGSISIMGMMLGIALISLDHLNDDDHTYLAVGVGLTSGLVGYWLPAPGSPKRKIKKVVKSRSSRNLLNKESNKDSPPNESKSRKKCCSCLPDKPAFLSKRNAKLLVFLIRAILSILGMFAGTTLFVLYQLNDEKGPYLTVGIGLVNGIIGYWLPSPTVQNRAKPKPTTPENRV